MSRPIHKKQGRRQHQITPRKDGQQHDGSGSVLLEQQRDAELTYKKLAIASFALRALFDAVLSDYRPLPSLE
jgi:hypothetical protein